jgi:hypothetical protein
MNKEKFIEEETDYLLDKMKYLQSLVKEDLKNMPSFDFNRTKTLNLIERLFNQEIDFLCEDTDSYRDLYNDEHSNN